MSEQEWKDRAVLEAQRNAANGQRAMAYETAYRYIIEKLQAHHKSRPGITEIIRMAKNLVREYGGLTPAPADGEQPCSLCGQIGRHWCEPFNQPPRR